MKNEWRKLDNAAKIFPSAVGKADTQVFRFSCELNEKINPDILQTAVSEAAEIFRMYKCTLKRGLFWYYLENLDKEPKVSEEHKPICDRLYIKGRKKLLFEVTYFNNRINLEIFHVLCDGTGAMYFLQLILVKYLSRYYKIAEPECGYDASYTQMSDDSFDKYYSGENPGMSGKSKNACVLKGMKYPEFKLGAISGIMSADEVLNAAHSYGASMTVFLCAVMMKAIADSVPLRSRKKPVVIGIPVNLRKRFQSESARNFFGLISSDYKFNGDIEFSDIIKKVADDIKSGLDKDSLNRIINSYTALEHNTFIRILPLAIKDIALRTAYRSSRKKQSAVLSNVGRVTLPKELVRYVRGFYVYASTNDMQACVCSFENSLSVNFTSPFTGAEVQRLFFKQLTDFGIAVEIVSNIDEQDEQ